jgi:hypothetical protein
MKVDATTNSTLMALARERFSQAVVDHLVDVTDVNHSVDVVILGIPYQCWRCGDVSTPIVGMMEPGRRVDSVDFVTCNEEQLLALAWQYLPTEARGRFRVGEVRRRYSKTIRSEYLSNGCATCGSLFGEFPLFHEELALAIATDGGSALQELSVVSMPVSAWTEAYESRWAYEPEEDEEWPGDEE